jgi:ATP-dependent DNA helicase DinG
LDVVLNDASYRGDGTWDSLEGFFRKNNATHLRVYPTSLTTAEECTGTECGHYKDGCEYIQAKRRIREAQVVITNHWLLGYHLRYPEYQILGTAKRLVVDEAHKLEDGVRTAFSEELSEKSWRNFLKLYEAVLDEPGVMNVLPEVLPGHAEMTEAWKKLFKATAITPNTLVHATEVMDCVEGIKRTLIDLAGSAGYVIPSLIKADPEEKSDKTYIVNPSLSLLGDRFMEISKAVEALLKTNEDSNLVAFLDVTPRDKILKVVPIELADPYGKAVNRVFTSQVYLSATLAVNQNLDVFQRRLGISAHNTAVYGTAFDLDKQAILYLSNRVPQPTRDDKSVAAYREALTDEIGSLIGANGGNAFVLFTARDEMEHVYGELRYRHTKPIVMQDKRSAADTLRDFLNTPNATLFGLKSFWEGVDVAGDKLSLVILTKLPFPNQSDPIAVARRAKAGEKWFSHVDLPDMIFDLRQGVGRLIRTASDRGVLAILDSRIITKPYGQRVLNSLGFKRPTTNTVAVLRALNNLKEKRAR